VIRADTLGAKIDAMPIPARADDIINARER